MESTDTTAYSRNGQLELKGRRRKVATNKDQRIDKNVSGIKRLPRAIYCSMKGYKAAWIFESGFRQYAVISLLLLPVSFIIASSILHTLALIGCLVFLLFSEIINSALEAIADATIPEYNPLIGRAKDLGSAGVFTALMFALLVWSISIYHYFH
jgi:diacylglycerol kinase (ATP)